MARILTTAFAAVFLVGSLFASNAVALSRGGNSFQCGTTVFGMGYCTCAGHDDCKDMVTSGICMGSSNCTGGKCWCPAIAKAGNGHKGVSGTINGRTLGTRNFRRNPQISSGGLTAGALTNHPQLLQTHPALASPTLTSIEKRR